MAIYHLQSGFVSRSSGRSSVQSAAYITGATLHESRRDLEVSYKNRLSDIAFTDTLAPEHAPSQFHDLGVWDILENFEDAYADIRYKTDATKDAYRNSARTAQTIVVALPKELAVGVDKELVEEFALTRFVSRGLIVTYAIHDDEGNPHAHLQISRRAVDANGELAWAKDRDIVTRKSLLETRKLWADLSNKYLEREGFEARITEKSFADLGVNLEPTQHRGWVSDKLEAMGVTSRIVVENAEVFTRNREVLIETPSLILPEMTSKAATFTQLNLLKAVQKRVGDDDKIVAQVFESALQQAVVVGEGMDGQIRYTTQSYKDIEEQAVNKAAELMVTPFAQSKLSKASSNEYIESNFAYLSQEQKETVLWLTQEQSLAVLIGRAGVGKTTILKAVSEIYQASGHKVIGASLAALAAQNLEADAGIKATTIHSWLYKWDRYQAASEKFLSFNSVLAEGVFKQLEWYKDLKRFESVKLTKDTVLIVDEAGMVGTRQWGELLNYVQRAGAKLIAVGDDNQFKAIEAGDFFRELKHQALQQTQDQNSHATNLFSLQEIRRQQHGWMREASFQLAELNISEGLSAYEQHGHMQQTSRANLSEDIATVYLSKVKSGFSEDQQTGLVLAFTNAQTNAINQAIREQLKQNGMIGKEDLIKLNGQNFAIGDRIVFLKNSKTDLRVIDVDGAIQPEKSIKNGTRGTIQVVDNQGNIKVQLADNCYTIISAINNSPKVAIGQHQPEPIREYNYTHIAHGYAVTTHKSQGQTVDFTIVAASKHMDAKGLYVAMTRHRDDVQLFYAKEDFPTFKSLTSQLSRFEHKDLVKDYTIRPENESAWQRVQKYRLCTLDAAVVLKQQFGKDHNQSGQVDWQTYHQIKQDQVLLGKEILQDFDKHQLYVNQAGLTNEMLQITTGLKARPLSTAESKAKITVELYGETAHLAREMWNNIRKSHPGSKCYSHPNYEQFNEIRHERNVLAQTIAENYPLHREFVNQFSRVYGINCKTVESQSRQFIQSQSTDKYSKKTNELWYNNRFDNTSYGKYTTSKTSIITDKDQLNSEFQAQSINNDRYQKSLDARLIKQELNANIKDLAYEFLGKPHIQKTTEWRYGNKGSISIHVAGTKQGLYSNFETGESGNALKLIQDQLNCDHKQAFKWGAEWLGNDQLQSRFTRNEIVKDQQQLPQAKQEWTPIYPAPKDYVDLKANSSLAYMLKGRQEINRYAYKDADSNILGYVVRLEDKQGNKITPTLTYCRNHEGKEQWRWQGFGNDRPLYGLDQLKQKPDAPVLVVEGEKTVEAAKALFPDHAVVTWSGGCGAVQKSDWSVLNNRDVTVWPDNDKPGFNAAVKITNILNAQGIQEVKIVELPPTLPHKWDLADQVPASLQIEEMLSHRIYQTSKVHGHDTKSITKEQQEAQEKIESIQQYLNLEITQEKNPWLSQQDVEEMITLAENKPYEALRQWQHICDDDSFVPLTKEQALAKEMQSQVFAKDVTTKKESNFDRGYREGQEKIESIKQYIQAEVTQERHPWLDKQDINEFKELAEKDPYGALKEWQTLSNDTSFTPMTKARAEEKMHKANEIIAQVSASLPADVVEKFQKNLPSHSEGVIDAGQSLLHKHLEHPRNSAMYEYRHLCERYHRVSHDFSESKQKESIEKRLQEIATVFGKDQKFLEYVNKLENKEVKQIAKQALEVKQQDLERINLSRGFER